MYAIIDIGSNTIRYQAYNVDPNGNLVKLVDKKEFARLASYKDDDGNLMEGGIFLCISILKKYKELNKMLSCDKMYVIATASLRNISNTEDVKRRIENECGISLQILSGEEEAYYGYLGSSIDTDVSEGITLDIGGGSTEIVVFSSEVKSKASLPFGSLNTYNKYSLGKRPLDIDEKSIKRDIKKELEERFSKDEYDTAVGVGGTIRALLKLKRAKGYEGNELTYDDVRSFVEMYRDSPNKWQCRILTIIPERIYTITPGVIILKTVMKYFRCKKIIVSENGIREGYMKEALR